VSNNRPYPPGGSLVVSGEMQWVNRLIATLNLRGLDLRLSAARRRMISTPSGS
jgi:hypothetical protein